MKLVFGYVLFVKPDGTRLIHMPNALPVVSFMKIHSAGDQKVVAVFSVLISSGMLTISNPKKLRECQGFGKRK